MILQIQNTSFKGSYLYFVDFYQVICFLIYMSFNKPLSLGDSIDLIAPGSPVSNEQIHQAVYEVESLGFKPRLCVGKRKKSVLSSGPDQVRFEHLKAALVSEDSKAVWCIRGGYGCQRLMPSLMKMTAPSRPKLFIGYSDATVLKIFFNLKWKWSTLHFPVLVHLPQVSPSCLKRFKAVLKGQPQEFKSLKLLNPSVLNKSSVIINSYLTGGNMTLIQSSIGTPWNFSLKNKIVFLEDIGEKAYKVDRALWQMWKAGCFYRIKALVLGDFLSSEEGNLKVREVFKNFSSLVSFPRVEAEYLVDMEIKQKL